MIRPSQDTPKERQWISNLDMVITTYHVPLLFFYKPNGSSDFFKPQVLKEALSKTLVPFYPMAGRLGLDENGRLEILCNTEGVLWVELKLHRPWMILKVLLPAQNCGNWFPRLITLEISVLIRLLWPSTYTILAAYIWRCATKARGLSYDQPTKLYMPTNGRPRLHPPLPSRYVGNAMFTASLIALSGNLQSESFVNTLERVHGTLRRMDNEYLRSALDYLETLPDITAARRAPDTFQCPNLNIINWIRLSIHDADFGWGRPIYMGPANIVHEGKIYLLPSPTDDGSLSLVACLQTAHIKLFEKHLYEGLMSFDKIKARY
ncbi:hypothetical protein PVK06_013990 [Gossypium arboreum]|uniref:Shikimate O-hydroxycinnamoyltransferase-like n=1 Tax=Gossypium arboreum TaxID=29729 RepID=A0ABR0PTI9_GOSAR|nr:hypothetical protein PVK06_013990 [Gossypium arboreum]